MSNSGKPDVKFCRECGAKIPRDSLFCKSCGAALAQTVVEHTPAELEAKPPHHRYTKRLLFFGIILCVVIISGLFIVQFIQTGPPSVTTTESGLAPDFTLPIIGSNGPTGQTFTLTSERGKVVLLDFMEPWSPHCQRMALVLESLYQQFGNGNVVIISVAGPWNGATASDAAVFIQSYGTNWAFVYDSSGTTFAEYGVNSVPTYYIIGTSGAVVSAFTGEQTFDTLSGAISAAGGSS